MISYFFTWFFQFLQFVRPGKNWAANLAEAPGGSRRLGVSPDFTESPGFFVFSWEMEISEFLSKDRKNLVNDVEMMFN